MTASLQPRTTDTHADDLACVARVRTGDADAFERVFRRYAESLYEQRISTVLESSGDRAIAIRMYGLAAVDDTTWGSADTHATLMPIPNTELSGRSSAAPVCP